MFPEGVSALTGVIPTVCKEVEGVFVPIPTLPDPLTNRIFEEELESISNNTDPDEPEMWSEAEGYKVPIPKLPVRVNFIKGVLRPNVLLYPANQLKLPDDGWPILKL